MYPAGEHVDGVEHFVGQKLTNLQEERVVVNPISSIGRALVCGIIGCRFNSCIGIQSPSLLLLRCESVSNPRPFGEPRPLEARKAMVVGWLVMQPAACNRLVK